MTMNSDKKISQNVSNIVNLKSDLLGRVSNLAGVFNLREATALIDRFRVELRAPAKHEFLLHDDSGIKKTLSR